MAMSEQLYEALKVSINKLLKANLELTFSNLKEIEEQNGHKRSNRDLREAINRFQAEQLKLSTYEPIPEDIESEIVRALRVAHGRMQENFDKKEQLIRQEYQSALDEVKLKLDQAQEENQALSQKLTELNSKIADETNKNQKTEQELQNEKLCSAKLAVKVEELQNFNTDLNNRLIQALNTIEKLSALSHLNKEEQDQS